MGWRDELAGVLIDEATLQRRVRELGAQITRDYPDGDLVIVFILKGALLFVADLIRAIDRDVQIDFMVVSSYGGGTETSGSVKIVTDLSSDIRGRQVLIVEDIIDSGLTLAEVMRHLRVREPAGMEICTLLSKPARRRIELEARYTGFEIADTFVVGYGLDVAERFRNLPFIGLLKS